MSAPPPATLERRSASFHVAIVGATGAVGREMLSVLEQRAFPCASIRLLASPRSAGQTMEYAGRSLAVEVLDSRAFDGIDIALFSAGGGISRDFAPLAVRAGATVIDNSSAFRMDPSVPLVIPEVNPAALDAFVASGKPGIIANPNCSTIIMLMAVTPIHLKWSVRRIVVSTYQAASGGGAAAMNELFEQTKCAAAGQPSVAPGRIFKEPYAFNLFSHNTPIGADGYNVEEQKMVCETHKIWNDSTVRITPTCVRVPVMRAHCESINLTLKVPAPTDLDEIRRALSAFPGVRIIDDRNSNDFPTPLKATGGDDVLVGRIRHDQSQTDDQKDGGGQCWGLDLFVAGDQLRKGAALNAIQIAEALS